MAVIAMHQDIVSLLKADHEEARKLLKQLQDAKGQQAKRLFKQIQEALQVHTKVEEEIVYPEYRKCVGGQQAKVTVQESLTEHNLVDRVMEEMSNLQPSSAEWQGKATVLKELVEHHAKDEEKEMFPTFRKECSEETLKKLAQRVEKRKQELQGASQSGARGRGGNQSRKSGTSSRQNSPTKQELYEKAKKAGIEGRSQMDKNELQRALGRR